MTYLYRIKYIVPLLIILASTLIPVATVHIAHAAEGSENLLSNANITQFDAENNPVDYNQDTWGDHDASFSVVSQEEDPALRVDVSNYVNGDAKWHHVAVTVGEGIYTYQDMYRSSVDTHYFAQYTSWSGSVTYTWLGIANASATWQQKVVGVPVSRDTAKVAVFHIINTDGFLETK